VFGIAVFVGGVKNGPQRFEARAPRMMATLMLVVVAALAVPTLVANLHTPAGKHLDALSAACAVVLLLVFFASVPFLVRSGASHEQDVASAENAPPSTEAEWPLVVAIIALGFAGLVIVAVAGNAVENFVAVKLAADNRMDYAMSVVLNSALQVALAITPVL